jgi:transposase-like protein
MTKTKATQAERDGHVRAWEASGLSSRAYAARAGINPNTLLSWRWQQRGHGKAKNTSSSRGLEFIELAPPSRGSERNATIELRLDDLTVRVPDGFEPETIRRVLSVLSEARS